MDFAEITRRYAVAPQIDPADAPAIRAAGFTDVICNRPDEEVGPDLAASRTAGAEKLLGNILEPSRELTAGYPTGIVETKSGEMLTGILANETPAGVTLRLPGGAERIVRRSDITKVERPANSMMPDRLEAGMTEQDMADLLAFLTSEQ